MARRILGRILSTDNMQPLEGYRVEAYDHDEFDSDDYMGSDISNQNGDYSINYRGGHWDPAPHEWTWWRPDIYVRILAPVEAPGGWIKVWQSGIRGNWRLRNDLRINAVVTPPSELARSVSGVITWSNSTWPEVGNPGEPAQGVRVRAFDADDFPDTDDYMGQAVTNNEGRYRIGYRGGHWDWGSGGGWRPDIRIRVDLQYDGKWKNVHWGTVFSDVKHKEGLVYNAEAHFPEPDDNDNQPDLEGTYWSIRNCNPTLWIRIRFSNTNRWRTIMPRDRIYLFVAKGETFTFISETRVRGVWLYPATHIISGGESDGIQNEEYCVGQGITTVFPIILPG
ncbi:hypothetical protein NC796_00130 [Aliifodinibius sp. S!AR15-10]|uniref:hypothetical protein n=1 Tax=Aliifodinibius sp. S!AR15-10 TaxID=2950437 RepID=UPI0028554A73|nr:hypothetical protein [Aliifodinibius sp. S!AR15-10]MDR8389520.1 hypothetical protein [Aliifodinibius sp. S!AR15-10]